MHVANNQKEKRKEGGRTTSRHEVSKDLKFCAKASLSLSQAEIRDRNNIQ